MAQGGSYVLGVAAILPFHLHLVVLIVIVAAGVAHHLSVSSARQRRLARYGLLALLVVTMWPIGDIAASVSLSVATVQRLVIMLLVAPLLLLSMPTDLLSHLTRPAPVDFFVRRVAEPGVALAVVTVVGTADLELAGRGLGSALERRPGSHHPHRPPRGVFVVDSGAWPFSRARTACRRLRERATSSPPRSLSRACRSCGSSHAIRSIPALHHQRGPAASLATLRPTVGGVHREARLLHPHVVGRLRRSSFTPKTKAHPVEETPLALGRR